MSTINPAITENTECLIGKARLSCQFKVGVSLDHYVLFHFLLFEHRLALCNIPSKE